MNPYYEYPPAGAAVEPVADPVGLVNACIESGAHALLLDDGVLPPAFFDLSTRVAGHMVQRLTQYGLRMAAVVPDRGAHSRAFQDFAREADRGGPFRFFDSREAAIRWLETA